MTDLSTVGTQADLQLSSVKVPASLSPTLPNGASTSSATAAAHEDDSSTIKCICGYNDDDGNTVFCEICNTWQHIECYYPEQDVPEVHECQDCRPRSIDSKSASERQRLLREERALLGERRIKRPAGKSHKKKTKDPIQTNGWPLPDRGDSSERQQTGSPRDQPPPNKRPKTSHKSSASIASINQLLPVSSARRKHAGAMSGQSPVKSPPALTADVYKGDLYSPEFMRLCEKPQYQVAETNSFLNLGLANDLSDWVRDSEACAKATNGLESKQVFMNVNMPFEEFESMYPEITKHSETDQSVSISGVHPVIEWLTVNRGVAKGNPIGELKGQISRVEDYVGDPVNRWSTLRHPEPYVFFTGKLPVVIDAREEGNQLRHIRRSCLPNAKIQPIYAEKDESCRFVLMSEEGIDEGEEITIGWTLDRDVNQLLVNNFNQKRTESFSFSSADEWFICNWVSVVLANFGGCACRSPQTCVFNRFDRRGGQSLSGASALKPPKGRKGKRGANHVSPLSTGHATNSRASSEAAFVRQEQHEDPAESRSVSGSTRSKPASRDNTPGASAEGVGLGVELSERDRKKLQQYERRFENLSIGENMITRSKGKKRESAGSTLNTPKAATSNQQGDSSNPSPTVDASTRSYRSTGTNRPEGLGTSAKASGGVADPAALPPRECVWRDQEGHVVQKYWLGPKPPYVDKSVQTVDDSWRVHFDNKLHKPEPRTMSVTEEVIRRTLPPGKEPKIPKPQSPKMWPDGWPKDFSKVKPGQSFVVPGKSFEPGKGPVYDFKKGYIFAEDPDHPCHEEEKRGLVYDPEKGWIIKDKGEDKEEAQSQSSSAAMPPPPKPFSTSPKTDETMKKAETSTRVAAESSQDVEMADAPSIAAVVAAASLKRLAEEALDVGLTSASSQDSSINSTIKKDTSSDNQISPPPANFDTTSQASAPSGAATVTKSSNESTPVGRTNHPIELPPTNSEPPKVTTPTGSEPKSTSSAGSSRTPNLHVTLPAAPSFAGVTANLTSSPISGLNPITPSSITSMASDSVTGNNAAQSPMSTMSHGGLVSPAIQSSIGANPSPAKKKMSLKDYTKRKQAEAAATPTFAAHAREGEEESGEKKSVGDGESEKAEAPW